MFRLVSTLTLGLMVSIAGCGDDGSTGSSGASSSSDGSTTAGSATNPMMTAADSSSTAAGTTTDTPGTTTDMPGTTTDTPGTTTDMPGTTTDMPGTTTNGAMACDPEPMDDDCATCVKDMCCTQLEACLEEEGCTCFQECAAKNPGIPGAIQCGMDCDVNPLGEGTPTGDLGTCTQMNCGAGVCL